MRSTKPAARLAGNQAPVGGKALNPAQSALALALIFFAATTLGYTWWAGTGFFRRPTIRDLSEDTTLLWKGLRVSRITVAYQPLDGHREWAREKPGSDARVPVTGEYPRSNPPPFRWVEVPVLPQYRLFRPVVTQGKAETDGEAERVEEQRAFTEYLQRKAAHTLAMHGALEPGPPDEAIRRPSMIDPRETILTFTVSTAEHDGLVDLTFATRVERPNEQLKALTGVNLESEPGRRRNLTLGDWPTMTARSEDATKAVEYLMDEALFRLTNRVDAANDKKRPSRR
jgi:hypothetical protein